jgi:hypothetical protein
MLTSRMAARGIHHPLLSSPLLSSPLHPHPPRNQVDDARRELNTPLARTAPCAAACTINLSFSADNPSQSNLAVPHLISVVSTWSDLEPIPAQPSSGEARGAGEQAREKAIRSPEHTSIFGPGPAPGPGGARSLGKTEGGKERRRISVINIQSSPLTHSLTPSPSLPLSPSSPRHSRFDASHSFCSTPRPTIAFNIPYGHCRFTEYIYFIVETQNARSRPPTQICRAAFATPIHPIQYSGAVRSSP